MTQRNYDTNGYMEVKQNKLSKVGVFEYMGSSIAGAKDPNKIYKVYRSAEELSNPECIESFKLLPWVDEHEMLGSQSHGLTPAEKKGIHGVIGEDVFFDGEYLRGNLKVFSETLHDIIEDGKNELSCGYRCKYTEQSGRFDGEYYDYIQHTIRGNHLATVEEGRMGPDVAVMDHKFTFDSKDIIMSKGKLPASNPGNKKPDAGTPGTGEDGLDEMSMTDVMGVMKEFMPMMSEMMGMMGGGMMGGDMAPKDEMMEDKKDEGMDGEGEEKKDDEKESKGMDSNDVKKLIKKEISNALDSAIKPLLDKLDAIEGKAMDSALIETKSKLVEKISSRVGVFDHEGKTLEQIQDYGLSAFGLDCKDPAQKGAMLEGCFAVNGVQDSFASDGMSVKPAGSGWSNKHKEGAK